MRLCSLRVLFVGNGAVLEDGMEELKDVRRNDSSAIQILNLAEGSCCLLASCELSLPLVSGFLLPRGVESTKKPHHGATLAYT